MLSTVPVFNQTAPLGLAEASAQKCPETIIICVLILGGNQSNSVHLTKLLMEQSTSEARGGSTDEVCFLTLLLPQE